MRRIPDLPKRSGIDQMDISFEEFFEGRGGFCADEDLAGEEAVAAGVAGGIGFADGGSGSGGASSVGAIGAET